jgi:hypothetical protein
MRLGFSSRWFLVSFRLYRCIMALLTPVACLVQYLLVECKRTKTSGVLLGIYFVLLLLLVTSYLRTVVTLIFNPGYIPKGTPATKETTDQGPNEETGFDVVGGVNQRYNPRTIRLWYLKHVHN